jgi:hypothetical protein
VKGFDLGFEANKTRGQQRNIKKRNVRSSTTVKNLREDEMKFIITIIYSLFIRHGSVAHKSNYIAFYLVQLLRNVAG